MHLHRPRIMMQAYEDTFSDQRMSRSLRACSSLSNLGTPAIRRNARLFTEATIRRALNDGGAMCIGKELRDSTEDMYNDSFSGAGMYPDPKMRNASSPFRFLRTFRAKTGVRHVVAVRHHTRSQVSLAIDDIDSHVTLRHWETETAVVTSPVLDDVTAKFPNHLN